MAMKIKHRVVAAGIVLCLGVYYFFFSTNKSNFEALVNNKESDKISFRSNPKGPVRSNPKSPGCQMLEVTPPDLNSHGSGYLSLGRAVSGFTERTSTGCVVTEAMTSLCPAVGPDGACQPARTLTQINNFIENCGEPVDLFADDQFVFRFEEQVLATQQLGLMSELPSLELSKLKVLSHKVNGTKVRCSPGDKVKVMADLVDQSGKPRGQGLDDVRAWMVGVADKNRASAQLEDMRNGSYMATFPCLWPGSKARIYIGIGYPREYLRRVIQERRIGVYRLTVGTFVNGAVKEYTPCFTTPNLPWPCLCNYTASYNTSMYCGRPMDPSLNCNNLNNWAGGPFKAWKNKGSNEAETEMMKHMVRAPIKTVIKQELFLEIGQGQLAASAPCKQSSFISLWNATQPKGYFDSSSNWHSLVCKNEPSMSTSKIQQCLSHTTVRIFGDSNGWRLFSIVNSLMRPKCEQPSATSQKGAKLTMWNVHTVCTRPDKDFHLTFDPHKATLYAKASDATPIEKDGDVTAYIDGIPAHGRYIVLVHYYLHVTAGHLGVAYHKLLKLRAAVERVSARNKEVVVAFRGPHIIAVEWVENHSLGGDVQSVFYYQMVKDVFRDLQDKVIFLDGWEMSIAIENTLVHPDDKIPRAMVNTVLSYIC